MRLAIALAGEQFHRSHLAQIHAHRVIGAVGAGTGVLTDDGRLAGCRNGAAGAVIIIAVITVVIIIGRRGRRGGRGLAVTVIIHIGLAVDDIDAHFGQLREHVLDLLGGKFLARQDRVQFVMRHITAFLRGLDHVLDRLVRQVQQRTVLVFRCVAGFGAFAHLFVPCGAALGAQFEFKHQYQDGSDRDVSRSRSSTSRRTLSESALSISSSSRARTSSRRRCASLRSI